MNEKIKKAVEVVGSQKKLAMLIGCGQTFVSQMLSGDRPVPPGKAIPIEHATNGKVSRHELRPDIYPSA